MNVNYKKQRNWSDQFLKQQEGIIYKFKDRLSFNNIRRFAHKYDNVKDMEENTDLIFYEYKSINIALRVRNSKCCPWRDITIRSYKGGHRTELDKLKDGYGDYMLYCWGNDTNGAIIEEYVLFDLRLFMDNHDYYLLVKDKPNRDDTKFNIYDLNKIIHSECCIANNVKSTLKQII